jgi:hypothetical protein
LPVAFETIKINLVVAWLIAILIVGVLLGPGFLALGLFQFYVETRPRRWGTVQGTIIRSQIEHQGSGRIQQDIPIIEFEYQHNGIKMHGKAKFFTQGTYDSALDITERYPINARVPVHVNPKNAHRAGLESKITPASCFFILIGTLFLVIEAVYYNDLIRFLGL